MNTYTVQELADKLGIDRDLAYGLVRYLVHAKLAKFRGERPNPSGKGKGAHVYEIVDGAGKRLAAIIGKLEAR